MLSFNKSDGTSSVCTPNELRQRTQDSIPLRVASALQMIDIAMQMKADLGESALYIIVHPTRCLFEPCVMNKVAHTSSGQTRPPHLNTCLPALLRNFVVPGLSCRTFHCDWKTDKDSSEISILIISWADFLCNPRPVENETPCDKKVIYSKSDFD